MPVRLRFRGLNRPLETDSCLPKNFIDPKPPNLQKGGFYSIFPNDVLGKSIWVLTIVNKCCNIEL